MPGTSKSQRHHLADPANFMSERKSSYKSHRYWGCALCTSLSDENHFGNFTTIPHARFSCYQQYPRQRGEHDCELSSLEQGKFHGKWLLTKTSKSQKLCRKGNVSRWCAGRKRNARTKLLGCKEVERQHKMNGKILARGNKSLSLTMFRATFQTLISLLACLHEPSIMFRVREHRLVPDE